MRPQAVLGGAEYDFSMLAGAVTITGQEALMNAGREQSIDLLAGKIDNLQASMANKMDEGIYSDGTGAGGKQIKGLAHLVSTAPNVGTVGGIDAATHSFWRNFAALNKPLSDIGDEMNALFNSMTRGKDMPKVIIAGGAAYTAYENSLDTQRRFVSQNASGMGQMALQYKGPISILNGGGAGGSCRDKSMYFLNHTRRGMSYRPHRQRNFEVIGGRNREPISQDLSITLLGWMGLFSLARRASQGVLTFA